MSTLPAEIEERIERLESRLALTEDLVDGLNLHIYRQSETLARLAAQLDTLREQLGDLRGGGSRSGDPADEVPPHW